MPSGNGTGPAAMGSMTGRAAGFCAGYSVPGYANPVGGRGFSGRGAGSGKRGRGNGFCANSLPGWARGGYAWRAQAPAAPFSDGLSAKQELDALAGQADQLEVALGEIKKRIQDIENRAKDSKE